MGLYQRIQEAAGRIAANLGQPEIKTINLIDAAAELCFVLREETQFVEALRKRGIALHFKQREPRKYT